MKVKIEKIELTQQEKKGFEQWQLEILDIYNQKIGEGISK